MADEITEDLFEAYRYGYFELFRQLEPDPQFTKRVVGTFNFGELVFDGQTLDNAFRHRPAISSVPGCALQDDGPPRVRCSAPDHPL